MKILIIGRYAWEIYEPALAAAFRRLGCEVEGFSWSKYMEADSGNFIAKILKNLQRRFLIGPFIVRINKSVLKKVEICQPELVFLYRGTAIFPKTVRKMKCLGARVFGYNNDDPFGHSAPAYYWRHFLRACSYYDWIFAYRVKNVQDYCSSGLTNVSLLKPYYIKKRNFSLKAMYTHKYTSDVSFLGHFENDGRDEFIKAIIDSHISFKLYGHSWEKSAHWPFFCRYFGRVSVLVGDYNLAINSAKIALAFLSKLNNDTYTRRNFEIPATKTFMLSEYTDDLNEMFKEGVEAEYFRDKAEMLDKIRYYLNHDDKREKIAQAGYERLLRDGHEVTDRAKEILRIYREYFG